MDSLDILGGWIGRALSGQGGPWVIAAALALTTLVLEDLAIAAGVALAAQGLIGWDLSFTAVAAGIALGDLGLYGMGLAAHRVPWVRGRTLRGHAPDRIQQWRTRLAGGLPSAVLLARVIPGLRLVTYTGCGFLRIPLAPFTAWVVLAVVLWTAGLYAASVLVGQALARTLGLPLPLAVALPVIVLALAVPLVQRRRRRAQT